MGIGIAASGGGYPGVSGRYDIDNKRTLDAVLCFGPNSFYSGGIEFNKSWGPDGHWLWEWGRHWGSGVFGYTNRHDDENDDDYGIYIKYGIDCIFKTAPFELFADAGPGYGFKREDTRWVGALGVRYYFKPSKQGNESK